MAKADPLEMVALELAAEHRQIKQQQEGKPGAVVKRPIGERLAALVEGLDDAEAQSGR